MLESQEIVWRQFQINPVGAGKRLLLKKVIAEIAVAYGVKKRYLLGRVVPYDWTLSPHRRKNMKFRIWGFAFIALFALVNVLVAQSNSSQVSSVPGYSLTIYASKPEVALGSGVWIGIRVTNVSKNPIQFHFGHYGNVSIGFKYDVRDEKGAELKKVQHSGGLRPIQPPGSEGPGIIQPGQSEEEATMVSDIYQFAHPGKYTIRVFRKARGMPIVSSNTITVTVKGTDSSGGSAHSSHVAGP